MSSHTHSSSFSSSRSCSTYGVCQIERQPLAYFMLVYKMHVPILADGIVQKRCSYFRDKHNHANTILLFQHLYSTYRVSTFNLTPSGNSQCDPFQCCLTIPLNKRLNNIIYTAAKHIIHFDEIVLQMVKTDAASVLMMKEYNDKLVPILTLLQLI